MTDIQQHLLGLLQEIDEICKEHGIDYYLDGGSALGAIRHRGFLPWDDDADIMMTRENWIKFRDVVRENPRPNRSIEWLDNRPDYTMVYARYCATDTTCILRTSMIDQFNSGLFVDLFVLDPIPDTPESRKEYMDILHGYAEYLNPYYYDTVVGHNEWYTYFCQLGSEKGKEAVTAFVKQKLFSYPDEDGMTYGFRYDNGSFIYPRAVVGKPVYVPFENTYMPVAERIEDYLRIHYGDNWFMIPPFGEEEGHNVAIDVNVPYETFKDSYMPFIDRAQAIRTYQNFHEVRLAYRQATDRIDRNNYFVTAQLMARLINTQAVKEPKTPEQYIAEGNFNAVRKILGNYYESQLNRWFLHHKVYIPLNDSVLYAALYLLLADGAFSKADKILNLRREQDAELTEGLMQIEELIACIRRAVRALEVRDYRLAKDLCQAVLSEHPAIPQLQEISLRARGALAILEQDAQTAAAVREDISRTVKVPCIADRLQGTELMLQYHFGTSDQRKAVADALRLLRKKTADGMLRVEIRNLLNTTLKC